MTDEITVYTIGHSTRPIEEFIRILKIYGIQTIADVRTVAGSRHNPQYNEKELAYSLGHNNIGYNHLKDLGGLRRPLKDSVNGGWKNMAFRGFADYMQTQQFRDSLDELIDLARRKKTAVMCAEAVPWRCHRSLIGDALLIRNISVVDIINEKNIKPHVLTLFAVISGYEISYPEKKA